MASQILWKCSVIRFHNTSTSVIGALYHHLYHYRASPSLSYHHLRPLSPLPSSESSRFVKSYPVLSSTATATRRKSQSLLWCSNSSSVTACDSAAVQGLGRGYLELTDDELMRQCEMDTFKSSGPGGQHRNKRESAVRLKHLPTGIIAQAAEDRSQHRNRASALTRLRVLIALKGTLWYLMLIHHLESFFKFFLLNHPSEDQIAGPKLDPIIPNLCWECKLYWTLFLQLRDQYQKLQSFLGTWFRLLSLTFFIVIEQL